MRTDGDWADFVSGVQKVALKYKPTSIIEFGCGFFTALSAIQGATGQLESYIGIDIRTNRYRWSTLNQNPKSFLLMRSSVHVLELEYGGADMVLIDAHGGSPEQYAEDTRSQCELADRIKTSVVVVDDCRIPEVAKEANFSWGPPTWKANEITGLWVWER